MEPPCPLYPESVIGGFQAQDRAAFLPASDNAWSRSRWERSR